jgi:hypothetical protein
VNPDELKSLRRYYHALKGHERLLDGLGERKHYVIEEVSAQPLIADLQSVGRDFPSVVPVFDPQRFMTTRDDEVYYNVEGLRGHVAAVVGRLSVEIESTDVTPVTESREFQFIGDPELRAILERDDIEIQKAYVAGCWKAVIVLSGGALEAILLDLALQHEAKAKASVKAPKDNPTRWDLSQLIDVCVDLTLVSPYVLSVSDATRAYRNLIHPGNELRTKLKFGAEEARIALTILAMVHRDLSR